MPEPLLATKFYRPLSRPNLVPRPRLFRQLDAGLHQTSGFARKLTLVSAPAGYGKTTLVAAWLNKRSREDRIEDEGQPSASTLEQAAPAVPQPFNIAWLALDESDNDPARFLTYLIAALKGVDESVGKTALGILQSPQPPPAEVTLTTLINDIAAVSVPIILALDDYHVIHTPTIHGQLAFLLDHLPPQFHLVVQTREDPPLPIARLRARGQVLEIRQDDLRFTADETAAFLQDVMGLSLSGVEIAALERRTEGWIAGLQLAALSMQGRSDLSGFIQAFTGSSRFILDYLAAEVFERQTSDVQDFLLMTSILERISGPLSNAVTERTDGQQLLETLEQANLFVVSLDQSRVWYRYHRLFGELLSHRLRASHPHLGAELHRRASRWYEAAGLTDEAIQHALTAHDWKLAGSLIQRTSSELLKRGQVLTVLGWFQALPEETLLSDPRLCFAYCWPLLLAGRYDAAGPLLERLEQAAQDVPAFLGEILSAQSYLAREAGDHKRMIERSQRALKLLPKSAVDSRGIVAMNMGLAYWHMGRMHDAEQVLDEAIEATQATGNHYAELTALLFLGRVFAVRGQLHQAAEYFKRVTLQGPEMPITALAHMDLAALHYEWNTLEESDVHMEKAIAICQRTQNDEFLAGCQMLCARLRIAQGDWVDAEKALEQACALIRAGQVPEPMAARMAAAQAHLLMERGEPVGEWGEQLTDRIDCHPFYRFLGVTWARNLPHTQARAGLEKLGRAAQANDWGYGLIAIRALQASLAENSEDALAYLTDALHLAAKGEFVRSFVEAGEKLIPLLHRAAKGGVRPDYVERILAAMPTRGAIAARSLPTMIEPLSERELEVLRLVAQGMSNREIAAELVISTGTAKSHVHNLCGKLGVRNRTEAAMRAREMELI